MIIAIKLLKVFQLAEILRYLYGVVAGVQSLAVTVLATWLENTCLIEGLSEFPNSFSLFHFIRFLKQANNDELWYFFTDS